MGAFWKMRANLSLTYGPVVGPAIAEILFLDWITLFDDVSLFFKRVFGRKNAAAPARSTPTPDATPVVAVEASK